CEWFVAGSCQHPESSSYYPGSSCSSRSGRGRCSRGLQIGCPAQGLGTKKRSSGFHDESSLFPQQSQGRKPLSFSFRWKGPETQCTGPGAISPIPFARAEDHLMIARMVLPLSEEKTEVGSYFISNYPPFSFWKKEHLAQAEAALDRSPQPDVPL